MKAGRKFRSAIQHYANPQHFYCRLCAFLPCKTAARYTVWYERQVRRFLYAPEICVD